MAFKLAFASFTLGTAHTLESKLEIAKELGYEGVEITQEDLFSGDELRAARLIKKLCYEHDISIISLQITNSADRDIVYWCDVAGELGTDLIQICWFLPMPIDLEMLCQATCRVAIEPLCWGPLSCWQDAWALVKRIDKANIGLCLDVFHIAGQQNPELPLLKTVDNAKIFYVQLGDGDAPTEPRRTWSNHRRFYGEGSLQILEIMQAINYHGWISLELFSPETNSEGNGTIKKLAARGRSSWNRFLRDMASRDSMPTIS